MVTKPFSFEGTHRMKLAEAGIERLQKHVDMLIIIPNQNLLRIGIEKMTILDTFKKADEALQSGVRCVTDLIVMRGQMIPPSADIHAVMAEIGTAVIGIGEAVGEHRSVKAPKAAITSPLLNDVSTKCTMLVNIIGGFDMTPFDINNVIECIHNETMFVIDIINDRLLEGINKNNIIFRSTFDKSMEGRMRVSIIATNEEQEISNNKLQNLIVEDNTAPSSFKIIAPANTPDEELAELISHLSNIYSSVGGDELKISKVRDLPSNTSSCKQSILQRKWLVK
ncbi:MAG: hypothetical protein KAI76_09450 [Alphaproteobacteria bacterium]|nr:hypothetical protein [Alphaproteobacteria bacterium]